MMLGNLGRRAVLAIGLAVLVAGCCKADPKAKKKAAQSRSEYVQQLKDIQAAMAAGSLPSPGPCPELEVKKEGSYGGWDGFATPVDLDVLNLIAGGTADEKKMKDWSFLTSKWLKEVIDIERGKAKKGRQSGSHVVMLSKSPYVLVLKATERMLPEAKGKDEFLSGEYVGKMVVFERKTAKALCVVPLTVTSSEEVKHRTRGLLGKSGDQALLDDFKERFNETASKTLKKSAPTLKVSLH